MRQNNDRAHRVGTVDRSVFGLDSGGDRAHVYAASARELLTD
jgi:hypothetical protein